MPHLIIVCMLAVSAAIAMPLVFAAVKPRALATAGKSRS